MLEAPRRRARRDLSRLFCLCALAGVGAAGCGDGEEEPSLGADVGPSEADERESIPSPGSPEMTRTAPDDFRVRFRTTKGTFVVEVRREWAPRGADRFYNLVRAGFYDGARFFRVIRGFVAQFGIPASPAVAATWANATIPDDSVVRSNERGTLAFAAAGPDSRTTQVFINLVDNERLDGMGFAAFGRVVEGMDVVDDLYAGYGEGPPRGEGPSQARIARRGEAYLRAEFPELDRIESATIVEAEG